MSAGTKQNRDLSKQLLLGVAEKLEESDRTRGGFNHLAARYAGNASRLLGFSDAEAHFQRLLASLTVEAYWAGAITNLDTNELPSGAKELSPLSEIECNHPVFPDDYAEALLGRMGEHLSPCASRDYGRAFSLAATELAKEEVILAQVLMGDYRQAVDSFSLLSESDRQHNVQFVMTIELYRRNMTNEAQDIHRRLPKDILCEWGAAQMAVGVADHVPWQVYPFPDY